MRKSIEVTAKTEDEAINSALRRLNLPREEVSIEILERAKSGFLGFGSQPAVIKVSYDAPDEPEPAQKQVKSDLKKNAISEKPIKPIKPEKHIRTEKPQEQVNSPAKETPDTAPADTEGKIRDFLGGLLPRMGINAQIEIMKRDDGGISVELSGEDIGAVIGRRGETLDAIQHLTNYAVNRGVENRRHIGIDAENYRSKREESLVRLAEKMAVKALKYKRSMALEPMNSYERHVIHTALQNYEGVTTCSTGSEPNRRVVISCEKGKD